MAGPGAHGTIGSARARPERETDGSRAAAPELEQAACAVCGEDEYVLVYPECPDRLLGVPGRFDVVRCPRCGLARTNPRPTRESIGIYYPDTYSFFAPDEAERSPAYGALRAAVRVPYRLRFGPVAVVEPPSAEGDRLLDVGSGAGLFLSEMAGLGWKAWGIEPNAELALRTAESLGLPRERIFAGSAEDAEFPHDSFDLVTMSHVLEHLHDPGVVLAKVARWLRPRGRLRILIPNFGSLERRLFGRHWQGLDVPRHLHHFSPATLSRLLEQSGFAVERIVPQWQGNMLTGSVSYALDAARGRRRPYRERRALHYALLPVASALLAAGEGGCMDVTARSRGLHDRAAAS